MGINSLFQFNVSLRVLAKSMLWFSLLSSVGSISANAGWDDSFIQGLNAHGTNSTIGLASGARLYNAPTNGQLPAGRVVEVEKSCVSSNGKAKNCKSSFPIAAIPSDRLAFSQCLSASNQDIGPPNFSTPRVSVTQGEYANISLSGDSTNVLAFTTDNGIYKMKSLTATFGRLELSAGQYWIETLSISSGVTLVFPTNGTVSFFIKNDYTHQNLNLINASERLLLYNYGDFVLSGSAQLNAYVFAEGTATLNGSANLTGALTANQVKLEGNTRVTFADTVANVTTAPNCTLPAPLAVFHLQFGQSVAGSHNVLFDKPFQTGVTPLVFAMATISDTNTNDDGPASVLISNISTTGFTWAEVEPPSTGNRYVKSKPMPQVHWIAVSPGDHLLSNGSRLIAGTASINQALIGSNSPYTRVALPFGQDVVLNQLQTKNNNCWFTSTSQFYNGGIELGIDASEVRTNNSHCQPGNLTNSQLKSETVAYMAVSAGTGTINLNSGNVKFHFGNSQTHADSGVTDLAAQCAYTTELTGFDTIPTLVAGKTARRGGDGGWLRRCKLAATAFSMVLDEDTYRDADRRHVWENFSFVALEAQNDVLACFTDDFNRSAVGDDWALKVLGTSSPPSIVNNRLRFTPASGNQATSSTYQRLFPAENNLVEIEFDYFAWSSQSGTGADGIAISLSDASITPQPGSFGGALGYAQRNNGTPGFAGGWLGIALDEYGNFSNPAEGKNGGPGFRPQAVAIRGSAGTSYRYLTGTNANLIPKIDVRSTASAQPNHRYKIIIDSRTPGKAMVSVLRDTQNRDNPADYVTLIAPFDALSFQGQAPVPEKFYLSITGSTGGSNNNHEMDNFKVCALKSEPVGAQVHHFEFDYSSSPLTCKAETMTVRACKDAACNLFSDPVQASLSPHPITNGAWYVAGNATNVINVTNGIAQVDLRHNVTSPITIGVSASIPGTIAGSNTLCRRGSAALNAASCTLSFAESGFIFDVPDKLANKPVSDILITAVKKSSTTQECVPTFANATKSVSFWSSYISPDNSAMITPLSVQVNDQVIGRQSTAATAMPVRFEADGKARIKVNYPDAGKMQLDARLNATGEDTGLVIIGSDQFVSFPVGLCVKAKDTNASCSAGNASCNVYKKAGEPFDLIIQGKAWESDVDLNYCDNLSTSNYAQNDIVLGHTLTAPAGKSLGEISTKYNHLAALNNINTVSQSVSEVGVFKFSADPPLGYLGSNFYDIPLAVSANIGRFVPASFEVINSSISAACNTFSYMDQGFDIDYTLVARNMGGAITQNYIGAFAKASISLAGENANNGVDLSSRLTTPGIPNTAWDKGVATITGTNLGANLTNFSRLSPPLVDGPFESLVLGLKVQDNDGNYASIASPDMNAANTQGPCTSCDAKTLGTTKSRHGRIVMDNTYGPESETLLMPTYAQYWNGSTWIINGDDSCTSVTPALDNSAVYLPVIVTGQSIVREQPNPNTTAGKLTLTWRNTGTNLYRGQVTAPLSVQPWLKWYWNWDSAAPNVLAHPRASAFFGRYRGHDRIIYWRETQ